MKITAAVLERCNAPLKIYDDIELPVLRPGQVLCRIDYAGLCHSQLMEARGGRGEDKYLPHMLGHEGVGEVIEVSDSVSKVAPGDSVVLGWIKGEGTDAGGTQYRRGQEIINAGAVTTFSNYAIVSENRIVKIPQGIDYKSGVLLGCALPTGAGLVLNQLKPEKGSRVGIFGLGGIGLSALMALKHFAPSEIVAFDVEPAKLRLAADLGATRCVLATEEGLTEYKALDPIGLDAIVESAGQTQTIEAAFGLIRRGGGKCIFASHPKSGDTISIDPYELICGKQIMGSWGGASQPDKDIPILVDIINTHNLPVHRLLSREYSLSEVNDALNDLGQRKIARALIKTS